MHLKKRCIFGLITNCILPKFYSKMFNYTRAFSQNTLHDSRVILLEFVLMLFIYSHYLNSPKTALNVSAISPSVQ